LRPSFVAKHRLLYEAGIHDIVLATVLVREE